MAKVPLSIPVAIRNYCAYQERNHNEVRTKLIELGARGLELENYITDLIGNDFLNEERYAKAYAGGKFRMLGWGKVKIKLQLKSKGISEYCIKKGMKEISDYDYYEKLTLLTTKKYALIRTGNIFEKRKKMYAYLIQKGYESNLIQEVMTEVMV
jgi:regulatory protein